MRCTASAGSCRWKTTSPAAVRAAAREREHCADVLLRDPREDRAIPCVTSVTHRARHLCTTRNRRPPSVPAMVERSRRTRDMNDNFNTRMILTTAVFAAVAALLVGPASAYVMDVEGGGGSGTSVDGAADGPAGDDPLPEPRHRRRSVAVLGHGRRARSRDPDGDRGRGVREGKRPSRRRPRGRSRTSAMGSASIRASSRASSSRSG